MIHDGLLMFSSPSFKLSPFIRIALVQSLVTACIGRTFDDVKQSIMVPQSVESAIPLGRLFVFVLVCGSAQCLSPEKSPSTATSSVITRKNVLDSLCTTGTTLVVSYSSSMTPPAGAACLPGDLSKECIGVYKVPMDDAISGMVGSKEALKQNAPDLNYIPPVGVPESLEEAMQILEAQRRAVDDIKSIIAGGRLEEAGIKVLNLVPRVTAAGRIVVQNVAQTSTLSNGAKEVQLLRLETKLDETLGCFGQVDVSIGQGLRGEMGVVTVAQLSILNDLKDAIIAFDEFLEEIPR